MSEAVVSGGPIEECEGLGEGDPVAYGAGFVDYGTDDGGGYGAGVELRESEGKR